MPACKMLTVPVESENQATQCWVGHRHRIRLPDAVKLAVDRSNSNFREITAHGVAGARYKEWKGKDHTVIYTTLLSLSLSALVVIVLCRSRSRSAPFFSFFLAANFRQQHWRPRALGGKSKVTEGTLSLFVTQQIITPRNYRVPDHKTEPKPQSGKYVTSVSHLECRFGLPSSLFFWCFCAFYQIKPSNLGPHSIQQLAIFMVFYDSYLGCNPYFPCGCRCFMDVTAARGRMGHSWRREVSPFNHWRPTTSSSWSFPRRPRPSGAGGGYT
jgi:hypothetical protein